VLNFFTVWKFNFTLTVNTQSHNLNVALQDLVPLYLVISALSFNLLALMRLLLPEELAHHRAITLRWRLYAIAAKVVRTGRQLFIKMKTKHQALLEAVLARIRMIEAVPI